MIRSKIEIYYCTKNNCAFDENSVLHSKITQKWGMNRCRDDKYWPCCWNWVMATWDPSFCSHYFCYMFDICCNKRINCVSHWMVKLNGWKASLYSKEINAIKWEPCTMDLPYGLDDKESACDVGDSGLIPGFGKNPWRREWLPTPVFLLENSKDRGAWLAIDHWVAKSGIWLRD